MIALFCGSRDWTDREAIRRDIHDVYAGGIVITGGARGADQIAEQEARAVGLHVARVDAMWSFFGKSAGPRRNYAMLLLLRPDVVYAFHLGGRGTADMINRAEDAGIKVVVRRPGGGAVMPSSQSVRMTRWEARQMFGFITGERHA